MVNILRNQIKTVLFLSSYTLLFLLLIIKNYANYYLLYTLLGVILISNLTLLIVIKRCSSLADEFIEVKDVRNNNSVNPAYLVTYIIPFLNIDFSNLSDIISISLLFIFIGFLYVKSDMIYMNPMLNLFKYNIFEVETKDNKNLILISKKIEAKEIEKTKFRKITDSISVG